MLFRELNLAGLVIKWLTTKPLDYFFDIWCVIHVNLVGPVYVAYKLTDDCVCRNKYIQAYRWL